MQQRELFEVPGFAKQNTPSRFSNPRPGGADHFYLTLRLDHLAILAIFGLVLYVLVFSFGVEKGKHFALEELAAGKNQEAEIAKELPAFVEPEKEIMVNTAKKPVAIEKIAVAKSAVEKLAAEKPLSDIPVVSFAGNQRPAFSVLKTEEQKKTASVSSLELSPVPAPPARSAPTVAAVNGGKYTIQLVTYISESRAQKEIARLKDMGLSSAFILPMGTRFQVCVDVFQSFKEAKEKLANLKRDGFAPADAFIRPLIANTNSL